VARTIVKYNHNNFSNKVSFYDWLLSRIVFDINCFRLLSGIIQFTFTFFLIFYLKLTPLLLQWCRSVIFDFFPYPPHLEPEMEMTQVDFFYPVWFFWLLDRWSISWAKPEATRFKTLDVNHLHYEWTHGRFIHEWICVKMGMCRKEKPIYLQMNPECQYCAEKWKSNQNHVFDWKQKGNRSTY
jgi:hypothetical protein